MKKIKTLKKYFHNFKKNFLILWKKKKFRISLVKKIVIPLALVILTLTIFKSTFGEDVVSTAWDGVIATSFASGNGSENNPYEISNGGELAYLKKMLESGQSDSYNTKHYIITSNINMGSHEWNTISKTFSGHINGKGHTVYNINNIGLNEKYGLFSSFDGANVENINLSYIDIEVIDEQADENEKKVTIGTLASTAKDTTINNVSLLHIAYDLSTIEEDDVTEVEETIPADPEDPESEPQVIMVPADVHNNNIIGGIIGDDLEGNIINNSYINVSMNSNATLQKGKVVGIANNIDLNNVVLNVTMNNPLNDFNVYGTLLDMESPIDTDSTYSYSIQNGEIVFDQTNTVTSILSTMNTSNNYEWYVDSDDDLFRVRAVAETAPTPEVPTGNVGTIANHASGVDGDTVYVNNLTDDLNNYTGKNYTYSTNGTIPDGTNHNIYNSNNLVRTAIRYNGNQMGSTTIVGSISTTETASKLVYYDYYVINTNGTSDKNDDYVEIPLIDNPYSIRPTDKAFNGWITSATNARISFDSEIYERKVRIPISYTENIPNDISLDMYASWIEAKTANLTSNWSTAISNLDIEGMKKQGGTQTVYDFTNIYTRGTVRNNQNYPSGAVNNYGTALGGTCRTNGGRTCTYYLPATTYVSGTTYYYLYDYYGMYQTNVSSSTITTPYLSNGTILAGYYKAVHINTGSSVAGYYNNLGAYQSSGNCSTQGGCTYYELMQYYDNNNNVQVANGTTTYYYLVTRDTNIVVLRTNISDSWSTTKPFTLTSVNNGTDYRNNYTWNVSNTYVNCDNDVRIENVRINSYVSNSENDVTSDNAEDAFLYGNYNNVKIGTGITRYGNYKTFDGIIGGDNGDAIGSQSNLKKYRLVVESGFYNTITLTNGLISSTSSKYIAAEGVYGSDYDRIRNVNSNLDIYYDVCGSWGGYYYSSNNTGIIFDQTVKSGNYGGNPNEYSSGIYIGGRGYGEHYATKRIKVEGGHIYNLIGGPIVEDYRHLNDTYAEVTGGTIDMIFGGAGTSKTYGNRIIQITGGLINYSVLGGSNSYRGSGDDGTLDGDSFIYVGGNGIIGSENNVGNNSNLWGVEAGSVFGIGNGVSGQPQMGSNNNSNVVIDGNAVIRNNVYGGGNFGATGASSSADTNTTNIWVKGGTIKGSVYGGGNNNGSGSTNKISTINVNMTGGNVEESLYGGANILGVVYGSVNMNVTGGTIKKSVYGGGKGGYSSNALGTYVSRDVTVNIGDDNNGPNIKKDVYGGSAFGCVNGTSNTTTVSEYETKVNIKNGIVNGAVYGGGEGNNTYTPYSEGNILVTVSGGNVSKVFGGNNASGTPNGTVTVNLIGGLVGTAFGGGNNASVRTTNISLNGGTATAIFGGSNSSGNVNNSNVNINSGTVDSVYGGNNIGGSTTTSDVNITGGAVNVDAYGGGDQSTTSTADINVSGGTVKSVYGGGNEASANNTTVTVEGGTVTNNVYGGGNFGTVTNDTNVLIHNGIVNGSVYGGGNGLTAIVSGNTNVSIDGNSVIGLNNAPSLVEVSVFGGGNAAPTGSAGTHNSDATVNIAGGTIYGNVYGGANTSVVHGETTLNIGKDLCPSGLTTGNILIGGTVFGGGEANASGSETYDYSFISVTDAIKVNINGNNHNGFEIHGSIFGSGDASTTDGTSVINISNYGTASDVKKNVSIQRTDTLTIKNSHLVLSGATDRTNEYSAVLFSLSRIKDLKLANNSVLYLKSGANLLENFHSLLIQGNTETKENVSIVNKIVTTNVNNRLYMYDGKVLNIATNEGATSYGTVNGMAFFGMYTYDRNGDPISGLYGTDHAYDDAVTTDDKYLFNRGSYVLGLHATNHNINVDGFYSNFNNDDKVEVKVIEPTPPDSSLYRWIIGELVQEYNVDLIASKYSTLGGVELPLLEYAGGNTTFSILNFNYNDLSSDVSLVDPDSIPRIAASASDANNTMGLLMKSSNTGWMTQGETSFMSDDDNPIYGSLTYKSENSNVVPTLLFYLYHSKNLSSSGSLGSVTISLEAVTRVDDLTDDPVKLIITVNMSRALYTTTDYEGALTAGREYEMFTSTETNITSKSSVSAYFSLYENRNQTLYGNGYHRSLVSSYILPENTELTLIDLSGDTIEYYYHVIDSNDVNMATTEHNLYGESSYNFSSFVRMGSTNSSNIYDDASMNSQYYNNGVASEEFIVIVDYGNANISSNSLDNSLLIELRNGGDQTILSVLGIQQSQMTYDIYADSDAVLELSSTINPTQIYSGSTATLDINTNFIQQTINSDTIYDTNYFEDQLGLKITILDSQNNIVSGSAILGLKYTLDGINYYPNLDGTTRINIASRVSNVDSRITLDVTDAKIATGDYTLKIESFASADGVYYGLNSSDTYTMPIKFINKQYGLKVTMDNDSTIIRKDTGKTEGDDSAVTFNVTHSSNLQHPQITMSLYRRKYSDIYSSEYQQVDLQDYVSDTLTTTNFTNEYLVANSQLNSANIFLSFIPNTTTGTYKIIFKLYDSGIYIGEVSKYIIITE